MEIVFYGLRMTEWDCIVVGAGIIGSWAAYHLSSAGKKTLLLDQV